MRFFLKAVVIAVCIASGAGAVAAGEVLNELIATVNNYPITALDLDIAVQEFKQSRAPRDHRNLESQVLDQLINKAIIDIVLEEEAVFISDKRVNSWVEEEQKRMNLTPEQYEKLLQKEKHMTVDEFKEEIREQMKRQNVMQLRVDTPNPTRQQIESWYRKNKQQIGKKYHIRMIQIKFTPGDTKDELRVNKMMKEAYAMAVNDFEGAAQKYSEHSSAARGGLLSWYRLDELIAMYPQVMVEKVYTTREGQVSDIFVAEGAYYIVKIDDTAAIKLEEVEDLIRQRIAAENQQAAFGKWLKDQRKLMAVEIYLKNYEEL